MPQAAIIALSGPSLTVPERALLQRLPPLGVILFARNIIAPSQLAALVASVKAIVPDALLMVDQEGGRVARLRPPHWRGHPAAAAIGAIYARDATAGRFAAFLTGALIGGECAAAGFSVVTAPVLDVFTAGAHDVIGDRAYGADPAAVAVLGAEMARGLLSAGVQPVGKHVPGHGRAGVDSHAELPVLDGVSADDILPFRRNVWLPWMMAAHIRYMREDMQNPATLSPLVIRDTIRAMGFDGVLVTDDLAMHALSGPAGERAARAMAAGCDVALHCSGVVEDSEAVLAAAGPVRAATVARLARAATMAAEVRQDFDLEALAAEREALLS